MILDTAQVVGGLLLLFLGGGALVRGAVALARHLGISPLFVSLVVVGFGTSMPELVVSLEAALKGSPDVAVGNVVGSNIANMLLILGASALVYPNAPRRTTQPTRYEENGALSHITHTHRARHSPSRRAHFCPSSN